MKPNQGHAHRLLQCLVVAVRPLRVEELAEVLAFDFNTEGMPKLNTGWRWEDQEEAVMLACSSLVTIVKDGDARVVQFSHFSVKEFLTADRLADPVRDVSRYHIRLEAAHTILAQACLGVLLRLDDRVDRDRIKSFPLARYAAQYWSTHARVEDVSSRIKDGMECLFDTDKPHFATWLWIYNEESWISSVPTMYPEKPDAAPLYYAARFGFRNLAEHLIAEHPEHVNAQGGSETSPMHVAAREGNTDILLLLLEHGAAMDGWGINGQTPLHRASWYANLDAGQCLLDHGADINFRDCDGWTPFHVTMFGGYVEFARMLLERGAEIDARNVSGEAPLHVAARWGGIRAVQLLLEFGADVNVRDRSGNTPSQLTEQQEIVKLLSEYGAEYVK